MKCPYCDGTGDLGGNATVGSMILAHRKARGITQQDLASLVGRSRPQIANIEAGRSDMPLSLLAAFAKALDVPTRELVP